VEEDEYDDISNVPDPSTLWRQMKKMGFKWQKPKYSDPRAKRDVIKWERCEFRRNQDSGALDPTKLISVDETNWYYEQATRAWGTTASPATLEKPKGKVMRRSMIASIGFAKVWRRVQGVHSLGVYTSSSIVAATRRHHSTI
jgi:hypothetical protein